MTKTELLEQILAELKAIHAALEADDKPTGVAGKAIAEYDAMAALLRGEPIDDDEAVYIVQNIAEAGRY